ncbi:MAG TPA: PD-(D/E)XK nuclease domain-containing protein [Polyangium sp.]|nr:PD-(D/E)XK nuclease domain-containing protein [Polyangium sp.]
MAGKLGAVLELKSARKGEKTIQKAMAEGLAQLAENHYAAELRNAGVTKIAQMAIAFDGKRVMVLPKGAKPPEPKKKSPQDHELGQTLINLREKQVQDDESLLPRPA